MTRWMPLLLLSALGCERLGCEHVEPRPYSLERAQFGVFFGGQVQELVNIPREPDGARQTIGIRLVFRTPPDPPLRVHWELARPRKSALQRRKPDAGDASAPVAPKPSESRVEYGDVMTRPGDNVLDIPLELRQDDPLGDWSVKVQVEGQQVLNRPFRVVKPQRRRVGDDF